MEQIKIGKKLIDKNKFIQAVNDSKNISDVCRKLNLNCTVQSTRNAIKLEIKDLKLNTSHFIKKYMSDYNKKKLSELYTKAYIISNNNQKYADAFESSIKQGSWRAYKSYIYNFLEYLCDKDCCESSPADLTKFLQRYRNGKAYIKPFMIYIIINNINNSKRKVSKDMLIWLINNKSE